MTLADGKSAVRPESEKLIPPAGPVSRRLPGALQRSQFVDRDVAAHEVPGGHLGQRRLGALADPAGQLPRAAGVEYAAAGRVRRGRDLAGQPDPLPVLPVDARY